jgi:nuclear pore complex protein Nup133
MIPSTDEIMSRWPGMSPEQVESLIHDYNSEQDRLGELELEEIFLRVHELAVNGVEEDDDYEELLK